MTQPDDLRARIAEALMQWAEHNSNPQYASMRRSETVRANAYSRADAVLAVLFGPIPAGTDVATWTAIRAIQLMNEAGRERDEARAAVLPAPDNRATVRAQAFHEAAEAITGHAADHFPEAFDEYADQLADVVRGLAGEAQQAPAPASEPTEARPPQHTWRVETLDPLANEWMPGSHFLSKPAAVDRYDTANSTAPLWQDGTPVQRRIVRETTTYTVEEPHGPAGEAQQTPCSARPCNPDADELCDNHAQERYHAQGEHAFCGPECNSDAQQDEAGPSDGARIGNVLIWSWADIGHGEFGRGYRAAQEEARALLTGQRDSAAVARPGQPETDTEEA
jgi:hypothetical protein